MVRKLMVVGLVLVSSVVASAQVGPAARGTSSSLTVGAFGSEFQIDAGRHPVMYGVGAYVDYNLFHNFGVEVEGNTVQFKQTEDFRRDSIAGGFRYIYNYQRFSPFAKALAGTGSADFPRGTYARCCGPIYYRQHDTFTMLTFGGGVDYKLTRRIYVRGQYEYQFWRDYGSGKIGKTGITNPNGFSLGASYRIF